MTTFLSIALLLVGTTATLAAFGGRTWKEGPEPILERITSRGWISLIALVFALILGVAKEIHSQNEDARKVQDARTAKAEDDLKHVTELAAADHKQADLYQQLVEAREELKRLGDLNTQTKETLSDVRGNLKTTREDLSQQNDVNLLTSFVNANKRISEIHFVVPFTGQATAIQVGGKSSAIRASGCSKDIPIEVSLWDGSIKTITVSYDLRNNEYRDSEIVVDTHKNPLVKARLSMGTVIGGFEGNSKSLAKLIDQRSVNNWAFDADTKLDFNEAAAKLLGQLSRPDMAPISFSIPLNDDQAGAGHEDKCTEEMVDYLQTSFDKALLTLFSADSPGEAIDEHIAIYYVLKAVPPIKKSGKLVRSFVVDSKPKVSISDPLGINEIMQYYVTKTDEILKEQQKYKDAEKQKRDPEKPQ